MAIIFPLKAKERVIPDCITLPRNLICRSGRSPALPYPAYEQKQNNDTIVVKQRQPPAGALKFPLLAVYIPACGGINPL